MLGAVALVAIGGRVVADESIQDLARRQLMGALLLLAGALLFGISVPEPDGPPPPLELAGVVPEPAPIRFGAWLVSFTALAGVLSAFAMLRFWRGGEDRLVVGAWLLSILALFAGQATLGPRARAAPRGGETAVHRALLLAILAIALAARLHRLGGVPLDLDGDFADWGLQARAIAWGEIPTVFRYGWAVIPILAYTPCAATLALAGGGLVGLGLAGVIESVLAIWGGYVLTRDLWNARAGVLAAALLTSSYTLLHFGRTCAYIDPVVLTTWALYFLVRALRSGSGGSAVAAGTLLALCLDVYYSGRIVVVVAPLLVAVAVVARGPRWITTRWRPLAFTLLAAAVTLGPMLVLFAAQRGGVTDRMQAVLVTDPSVVRHLEGVYHVKGLKAVVLEQARRAALVFHAYHDSGSQFGAKRPFLDPLGAAAVTLGVGWSVLRPRRLASQLSLVWMTCLLVFGAILTVNAVFFPRVVALAVPASILGGIALERLHESVRERLAPAGRLASALLPAGALAGALAVSTAASWRWYFDAFEWYAGPATRVGRWLAARPGFRALSVTAPEWHYNDRSILFLAPGAMLDDLDPAAVDAPRFVPRLPLVFSAPKAELAHRLAQRFPAGRLEAVAGNAPGEIAFFVYHPRG